MDTNGNCGGFVAIHRKIFDNPVLVDGDSFRAWCWLIAHAAWRPRPVRVTSGRAFEIINLERGQLTYSRAYLATAWGWKEKRVRTFLKRLKTGRMIDLQTGQLQTVISICNYNSYQSVAEAGGQQTGQTWARHGPEDKNLEQIKQKKAPSALAKNPLGWPLDAFDRFYSGYPKKVDRNDAGRAFAKVQAKGEIAFEALTAARDRYAEQVRSTERQFIKAPAVWLNKGSYLDEPARVRTDVIQFQPTRDASTFTAAEWQHRVAMWRSGERWPVTQWGPAPNEPGCRVPPELLSEAGVVA